MAEQKNVQEQDINQLIKVRHEKLQELQENLDPLEDICTLIDASIAEEPPISLRDGGILKEGYDEEIDKLRHAKTEGKSWLVELETKERERTGIKNLRIKYNKVFGYYLEVTNSTWYRRIISANRRLPMRNAISRQI